MSSRPYTISFVSGKGGVGKTSLATNLAWVAAKFGKVGFVDLDLQNQGATGLFASIFPLKGCGVLSDLLGLSHCGVDDVLAVTPDLYFFPAVGPNSQIPYSGISDLINAGQVGSQLTRFLDRLQGEFKFDVLILDCHGGLDFLSLAAHRLSDRTVVVTEADTVTFNGTLELLEFYRSSGAANGSADSQLENNITSASDGNLAFVVNRVSPKYKYDDLNAMYERLLGRHKLGPSVSSHVLCYVPAEDFFADSYGEYPFAASLAPKSVMFRKINLLAYKLLPKALWDAKVMTKQKPTVLERLAERRPSRETQELLPFYELQNAKHRAKVERTMVGRGTKNTQRIIITFALVSTYVSLILVAYLFGAISSLAFPGVSKLVDNPFVVSIFVLLSVSVLCYTMFTSTGLTSYYADKYQFQKRLWRALGKPLSNWQRLSLGKLLILRFGTLVGPTLFVLALLFARGLWY